MSKTTKYLALALAAITLLAGCSPKGSNEIKNGKAVEGGDFILGSATELSNFNPFDSITADVRSVNYNIFEGLVKVGTDGSFIPAVAEKYTISDDAKTYTFTLRSGIKFHDGTPVTMDDVLYSLQKATDEKFNGFDNIESIIPQENKIILQLKKADTGFVAYLTSPIVKKNAKNLALNPIGTGPFKFAEYQEQDFVRLEKFNEYWGKPAHLDSVTYKFFANQANVILAFQAGSIDGGSAPGELMLQLNEDEINQYEHYSNSVQMLVMNNIVAPFNNEKVRQAVSYLIDSQEIIDAAFYGKGKIVGSALIPNLTKYYNSSLEHVYDKNVAKAKQLLKEAGYENGFKFTITVPSVYTVHVRTAEVMVNQLAQAGIKAEIKQVDWATWLSNVYLGRQYETTVISVDGSLAYPTSFLGRYTSDNSGNFMNFSSALYDETYEKAVSTISEKEKIALFNECQKILSDKAACVFIQDVVYPSFYNKGFAGSSNLPLYATDLSAIYKVE